MIRWEYRSLQVKTELRRLTTKLNQLGGEGWEVVGFVAADKTIGLNSLMCLLKRPVLEIVRRQSQEDRAEGRAQAFRDDHRKLDPKSGLPFPDDPSHGWKADPTGRYAKRYWHGTFWGGQVKSVAGKLLVDDL